MIDPFGIEAYINNRFNDFFGYPLDTAEVVLVPGEQQPQQSATASSGSNAVANRATRRIRPSQARLDLLESPSHVVVRVDLPGYSKDNVQVHLEDNVLTIEAERKEEKEQTNHPQRAGSDEGLKYHYMERSWGKIGRKVWLPVQVDESKVQSSFKDGVLELKFSKKVADEKRKRIEL